MPEHNAYSVMIGGAAGQGLATIGQMMSKSLMRSGYSIVVTQDYQSRIRGGHNTFTIRFSPHEIMASQQPMDLLVALNKETVDLHGADLAESGKIIEDKADSSGHPQAISVPFEELGSARTINVLAFGIAASMLGLDEALVSQVMDEFFGHRHQDAAKENEETLARAFSWCAENNVSSLEIEPPKKPGRGLMINGNEALALGAISAGVKFYAFYPMTPSTSIALTMAAQAERMGLVVEQAEDEISAVNMAIGASFAGAPSMVGTSGGGFALMAEGVSLAAMTETPLVIAVSQRPGPATGLPTRTAQGDLEFVLHAGHGEFPRAIFAPGSVEECFYLARAACFLAEQSQGPVFILTDQYQADSYRAVTAFEVEQLAAVDVGCEAGEAESPYERYRITDSGVSPRHIPGWTENLVVADSDEHTPDGHLTEDLAAGEQMARKRLRKLDLLKKETIPPERWGEENPDVLLVAWGSGKGPVIEAARRLEEEGNRTVSVLYFSQVWPLIPDHFLDTLQGAKEVVSVEGNAFGQLAGLIRRETGFEIARKVLRFDGMPLTPEYIIENISAAGGKGEE